MNRLSRRDFFRNSGAGLALSPLATMLMGSDACGTHGYGDSILVDGEPDQPLPGSFTLVVLPDTQYYSDLYPDTFLAQTKWIAENQKSRNIVGVLHLGDITDHNQPEEWKNAVRAMSVLDGSVPYFLVPGNHDYSERGHCEDRTTLLNEYFPISQFRDLPTFGGTYDKEPERMENSFHLLSAGECRFLVLGLEFGPRRDVVRWANEIVAQHKDRSAILITHAYMYFDDTRYAWQQLGHKQSWNPHSYAVAKATSDDVMDGDELWTNLVSRHENFVLTINGHVLGDGLARLTSNTSSGRSVHQLLVNFQMRPKGGDGWLRLLEFRPDGNSVHVYDYSPTRRQCNDSPQNRFSLQLSDPTA